MGNTSRPPTARVALLKARFRFRSRYRQDSKNL